MVPAVISTRIIVVALGPRSLARALARSTSAARMRSRADLESIWRFCTRHREHLAESERAGCFHCLSMFPPAEITEWIDEPDTTDGSSGAPAPDGVTALCPRCGIDAVLPSSKVAIDPTLLQDMAAHYFGMPFPVADPQAGAAG